MFCNGPILTRLPWKNQIFKDTQRISGTALSNIENFYCISWSTKIKCVTFVGYSCNSKGIVLYSIFPGHYFGIFLGISLGIFSEYTGNISREFSTDIPGTNICPVGNGLVRKVNSFVKSSMCDVWHGSISVQFLKNLKLNRLINIE